MGRPWHGRDGLRWRSSPTGRWDRIGRRWRVPVGASLVGLLLLPLLVVATPVTAGAAGGGVTNFTGTGISGPDGIAWGPDGNLWFTNETNNSIGSITTTGTTSQYQSTAIDQPTGIVAGPDGALWFTDDAGDTIGRITTSGVVTTHPLPTGEGPSAIATGPDGNLWFTDSTGNTIGRITPAGVVTVFKTSGVDDPNGITAGPDGNLWFTNTGDNSIGRITTTGVVTDYSGTGIDRPLGITAGPDGNLWFTNGGTVRTWAGSAIGTITTAGVVTTYTASTVEDPTGIAPGSDGALWFTNVAGNSIGRITTTGSITNFGDPTIDVPAGIAAGPDQGLWFTNAANSSIGRVAPQGAVTADGSASCSGVAGQTSFNPALTSSPTPVTETATTTLSLTGCSQQDNDNVPGTGGASPTLTGTLTATSTFTGSSCTAYLAGTPTSYSLTWTASPAPTDGIAPTTLTSTGTENADGQNLDGDLGMAVTGATSDGSYAGPASLTLFAGITRSQFLTDCGTSGGVSSLAFGAGEVSAGMAASGPAITTADTATFIAGAPNTFAVTLDDALNDTIQCIGNLPPGVSFVPDPDTGGGQLTGTPLPGSGGTYPLTLVAVDAASLATSQPFTLTVDDSTLPYVSGVSPSSGTNSPEPVTIAGQNLGGPVTVDFGSVAATDIISDTATSITVDQPPATAAGPVDVTVTSPVGPSTVSPGDRFTYDLPPQAPAAATAQPGGLSAYVSWAPNSSADAVTGYTATAAVAAGYPGTVPTGCGDPAPVSVSGDVSAAEITGLCSGVPYATTLTATNAYGTSPPSTAGAPVAPFTALPPSEPLITSVVPGKKSLLVNWNPPADDGGTPLTTYLLTATAPGEKPVTLTQAAPTDEDTLTGLVDGATYTVSLSVTSSADLSSAVVTSTGTPEAKIAPAEPMGLEVQPDTTGDLVASWVPPATTGTKALRGYILSYDVTSAAAPLAAQRAGRATKKGVSGKVKLGPTVTSDTLTGLSPDSYYDVSIVAVAAGDSPARTTNLPVTPGVALNPGTIELTGTTVAALSSDVGGVLTWPSPVPSQLSGLTAGAVLASTPTAAEPDGLLAQVQSVYPTPSGGITVYTTGASTSQAFLTYTFSISGAAPGNETQSVRALSAGVRAQPDGIDVGVGTSGTAGLNVDFGDCGNPDPNDVAACLDASVSYALDAGGGINIACLGVRAFGDCIGVPVPDGVNFYADAFLGFVGHLQFDGDLNQQYQLVNDILGVIPLFFGIVLTPTVIADLDLSGALHVQGNVGDGFGGGVECHAVLFEGAGCSTSTPNDNIDLPPGGTATLSANGTGSATLQGEGALCIDVVACLNFQAQIGLVATINTAATPYFTLCGQVSLAAGLNLDLVIHNFNWDTTIYSDNVGCVSTPRPPPTLTVAAIGQPAPVCNVPVGSDVQGLTATRSDGASDPPIAWKLQNGISGDSISSAGELTTAAPGGRVLIVTATDSTGLTSSIPCLVGTRVQFSAPTALNFALASQRVGLQLLPLLGQEEITWQPPANDGGSAIVNYRICLVGASKSTCADTGGATSYQVADDIDPGTSLYTVQVWAINASGASSPAASGTFNTQGGDISGITIVPGGPNFAVQVSGAGFGPGPDPPGTATNAGCGGSGQDFSNNSLVFQVVTPLGQQWTAGATGNCIGLLVAGYSDNLVTYGFGSEYGAKPYWTLQPGDTITMTVNGTQRSEVYEG